MIAHPGDPERCVVVLPGMRYSTQAPLLWFAREVALARGWSVLEAPELLPEDEPDPFAWALRQAEGALAGTAARVRVLIGKSLSTAAAALAADHGLPGVWLTPLLDQDVVIEGLARASAPALLVGGTADPTWRPVVLPANPGLEPLELDGLDHSLRRAGDPGASLDALRTVTEALDGFLARLN